MPTPAPPAAPPPQLKPDPVVSGIQGGKAPPKPPSKPPAPASKIGSCKKGRGGAETTPASVFVGETSTLRISSKPWSEASLNGKPLGRSHRSYEVPTGCHTLTLVTEDGRTQSIDVTLAREALTVCWDFERGDVCSR